MSTAERMLDVRDVAEAEVPVEAQAARVTTLHVLGAATAIILLPNLLFALRLAPVAASLMLAGVGGVVAATPWRRPAAGSLLARPLDLPRLGLCLAGAFLLLILGGEGHLFFSNYDWLFRDAVLSDLVGSSFPPNYDVAGEHFILRAPLGMYLAPAVVGRFTTLAAGHVALLAQNTLLLGAILYLLAALAGRRAGLVILVFLTFSGLDAVGQVLVWLETGHELSAFVMPSHIEGWMPGLQYSSVVTQLFWVPNHALPSYWLVLLALLCAKREIGVGQLGLAMAASLLWSPFAVMGILPLAAALLVWQMRTTVISPRFWLAAGIALCFLPVAFYLKADAGDVPFEVRVLQPFAVVLVAQFLLTEIPHVAVVGRVWRQLDPTLAGLMGVAIGVLVLLPSVRLGHNNDLVMRASLPALTILSIGFAESLTVAMRGRPALLAAGIGLILVGSVTPAQEIARALTIPSYGISDCNIVTVWKKLESEHATFENYLARPSTLPAWLLGIGSSSPAAPHLDTVCWPDIAVDLTLGTASASTNSVLAPGRRAGVPRL